MVSLILQKNDPGQNKATVRANIAVCGSAIRNFVTDILMTLAIRNICALNPKMCLPKRTPKAPFLLNFSSIFRGVSAKFL